MPPKVKITKSDIINTALELVRTNGEQAINARAIASALNCSTQPIFSNFTTMEQLQSEVIAAAYELYLSFLQNKAQSGKYPTYKAYGMAYIRFAKEEKGFFRLLFMRNRDGEEFVASPDFEASVEIIMKANNISKEKAELVHFEMWAFVHGIATMLATSYLSLDWERISDMMTDIYQGVRARHLSEEV